ncbi:hypothetical protein Ciccas_008438 [Cichlidogyrus casuarinus]|uniref:Uncharacterized protein n=1 Tax=Cichlidogyrus casuarinus TaxID=1844966 RepID=A0ABD2PZY3_9PLAT
MRNILISTLILSLVGHSLSADVTLAPATDSSSDDKTPATINVGGASQVQSERVDRNQVERLYALLNEYLVCMIESRFGCDADLVRAYQILTGHQPNFLMTVVNNGIPLMQQQQYPFRQNKLSPRMAFDHERRFDNSIFESQENHWMPMMGENMREGPFMPMQGHPEPFRPF